MRTRLKEARRAKGYTQALLAKAIGITPNGYRMIETGKRDGTIETWRRLVDELGIPNSKAWLYIAE